MAKDKNERMWMIGGAVSALALAGALWTFVVSPEMDSVDSLRSQTANAQTQNVVLRGDVDKLAQQYSHIGQTKQQLAAVQRQLPSSSGMSALTTQLNAQAQAHHVSITQVNAAQPTTIASAAPAAGATGASSASTSAAPAAGTATPAPGAGLYVMQVAVSVNGSPANELAFARAVQHDGPRAALVDSVQMQSGQGSGSSSGSSMTLTINVYVAPTAPTPSAAPTAPTPSATPSG